MARKNSLIPSSLSTSRQSSLAFKGCSEPLNDAALQFKLSKKVAELTLVVHMLFTRNHEREVEIESTKLAYEQEIDNISYNYQKQISGLKVELESEKWKRMEDKERLSKEGDEHARKQLERYDKKIAELTESNEKFKSESTAFEGRYKMLKEEYSALEKEHDTMAKERSSKDKAMEKDHLRIEKLQQHARVNKEMMEKMKENIHNLQKSVNVKISQIETNGRSVNERAEQLRLQNEQLELENRNLRKKCSDQGSLIKRLEAIPNIPSSITTVTSKSKSVTKQPEKLDPSTEEEIERLKREVRRYRLELSNRESNFNKIFSDIKPVMVNTNSGLCVKEIRDESSRIDSARSEFQPSFNSWRARKILTPF